MYFWRYFVHKKWLIYTEYDTHTHTRADTSAHSAALVVGAECGARTNRYLALTNSNTVIIFKKHYLIIVKITRAEVIWQQAASLRTGGSDLHISPSLGGPRPCLIQCYLKPRECPCQMAYHSIQRL